MKFNLRFLAGFLALSSCMNDYEERIRAETVPAFKVIKLQSVFTVILKNDSEYSVSIIGDDDVISEIELISADETLTLINHAKGKLTNPERNKVTLEISAPDFQTLIAEESYVLYSAGRLTFNEFSVWNFPEVKVSEVSLDVEGHHFFYWNNWLAGGKLILKGNIESVEMHNYALHLIEARNLNSNYTTIFNYGREDCEVRARTQLQYSLNGPGNIIVYGHPPAMVLMERTSTGQLILGD